MTMAQTHSDVEIQKLMEKDYVEDDRLLVVCFHGQAQNKVIFEHQMSEIINTCQNDIQFVFLEDSNKTGMKHFDWWSIHENDVVEKCLQVYKKLEQFKRVDAILGFSQGASLVEILDRLVAEQNLKKLWNISILASGIPLLVPQLVCSKPLKELSLHFSGKLESERIGSDMLQRYQREYCKSIQHEFGHEIPKDAEFASYFHDALLATYTLVGTMKESMTTVPVQITTEVTRVRIGVIYSNKLTHYQDFCTKLLDSFDQTKYTLSLIFVKVKTPSTFRRFIQDDQKEVNGLIQDLDSIGPVDILLGLPGTSSIFHKVENQIKSKKCSKTWTVDVQFSESSGKSGTYDINDDKSIIKLMDKIKNLNNF
ncbi:hypothetical protein BC833DRAFT_569584 [Globomyces pollinis-pini]|nr:hypothetical protein BC833DRAFT_569584 [Globomyces pollinis-pini]